MAKKFLIIIAVIVALMAGFLSAFLFFPKAQAPQESAVPLKYVLPEGARELTPCIPQHGAHWGLLEEHDPQDNIQGPSYLLNERGEVIGMEYHVRMDYLEELGVQVGEQIRQFEAGEIGISDLKVADLVAGFDWMGRPIQYGDMDFKTPYGHPGYEMPHIDVHGYTISRDELMKTCLPPAP